MNVAETSRFPLFAVHFGDNKRMGAKNPPKIRLKTMIRKDMLVLFFRHFPPRGIQGQKKRARLMKIAPRSVDVRARALTGCCLVARFLTVPSLGVGENCKSQISTEKFSGGIIFRTKKCAELATPRCHSMACEASVIAEV